MELLFGLRSWRQGCGFTAHLLWHRHLRPALSGCIVLGVLNYCKMWWPWLFQGKTFQPVLPAGVFRPSPAILTNQPQASPHVTYQRCQAPEWWWPSNSWSHFMLLCFEERLSKGKWARPTWSLTKLSWLTCRDGQMLSGVIGVLQPALWVDNLSACHPRCSRDYGSHVNMQQHSKFNNTQLK